MTLKFENVWNRIKKAYRFVVEECIKFPMYIIFHPFKGFDEFKRDKRAKVSVSIIFIVALIFLNILAYQYEGFIINTRDVNDLNSFAEVAYILVPILVFVFANWSITTLFDGKGKVIEIFMLISYSLFPLIVAKLIGLFVSNFVVQDEVALYSLIQALGTFGTGLMLFTGLVSIHEYGIVKCFITVIFTLLSAAVILFVGLLCFDLFQKVFGFVYTIYREISLRYF